MSTVWEGIKTMSDMQKSIQNSNPLSPLGGGGVEMTGSLQKIYILSTLVSTYTIFVLSFTLLGDQHKHMVN